VVGPSDAGAPAPPPFWRAIGLTFEACVRNARACLLLSGVYALFVGVALAMLGRPAFTVNPTGLAEGELLVVGAAVVAAWGTSLLVGIFVLPPTIGALTLLGSATVEGDEVDAIGVLRRAMDRALEAIGAGVLTAVIVLGPVIALGLFGAVVGVVAGREAGFAVIAFAVLLVIPVVYVAVALSLAVPVVMREGLGAVDALRRSWELVRHHWWWVFGVYVVVGLVASVINGIVTSLGTQPEGVIGFLVAAVLNTIGAAIFTALLGVAVGVVYSSRTLVRGGAEPAVVVPDAPSPPVAAPPSPVQPSPHPGPPQTSGEPPAERPTETPPAP
jgi:hypothetical protein